MLRPRVFTFATASLLVMACQDAAPSTDAVDEPGTTSSASGTSTIAETSSSGSSTTSAANSSSSAESSSDATSGGSSSGDSPCIEVDLGEPDCHPHEAGTARGAWFRKVVAPASPQALAIHGVGTLPRILIDHERWFETDDPALQWQNGPLDRPSVYMGGRASEVEIDAGLTWDRVYHVDGRPAFTDLLDAGCDGGDPAHRFVLDGEVVRSVDGTERPEGLDGLVEDFAFRPFWRAQGMWHNPPVGTPSNVYFFPEQPIRMQMKSSGPTLLELTINADDGDTSFSTTFEADGWGVGAAQEWKRVNSIDQFTVQDGVRIGAETAGIDVLPTATLALDARWNTMRVLGAGSNPLSALDCAAAAVIGADAVVVEDYEGYFRLSEQSSEGGETISIVPIAPDCGG